MRRSLVYGVAGAAFGLALVLTLAGVGDDADALTNPQALVLGIVQGLTELLPISSSGHLILVPWAADWTYLKQNDRFNQTFDVALHLGTFIAVGAYFWGDIVRLVGAWLGSIRHRRVRSSDERIAWFVLVATIPAGIVGLLGEDAIADSLGEPWQIAILLAAGAVLLWFADRAPQERTMGDLGMRHAVVMGLAQALALAPGVSRSGITITAGRLMRLDRDAAARFSFLLLLPTVLGALVLKGVGDVLLGDLPNGWQGPFLVGTLASLASGLVAIDWLLGYVRRHTYDVFVWYRLLAAMIIGLLILSGVRAASF
ncbi:MAG: undecaprenyl-diphosphatase UppP [Actinobacteria bacterium]|nr:undecaprenyl-diphosphatase UppP [Actinomycetota bacterium]MBA3566366.1 undecaprenyl-diphosphatase UppP [Actinomycetota bacterium]MDQ3425930.1 undecaprenyl-diphosphatase UppP [Actinomycetota bacterium]